MMAAITTAPALRPGGCAAGHIPWARSPEEYDRVPVQRGRETRAWRLRPAPERLGVRLSKEGFASSAVAPPSFCPTIGGPARIIMHCQRVRRTSAHAADRVKHRGHGARPWPCSDGQSTAVNSAKGCPPVGGSVRRDRTVMRAARCWRCLRRAVGVRMIGIARGEIEQS